MSLFRDAIDPADPERTKALFAGHAVPAPVAEEIRRAYRALGDDVSVAVRSSATAEDLPTLSFAGQQDTYSNIAAEEAEWKRVGGGGRRWGNRARVADPDEQRLSHHHLAGGRGIGTGAGGHVSGIWLTADPITGGRRNRVKNAPGGWAERWSAARSRRTRSRWPAAS